ncbi:MAG: methyltransferase domain-containing protein [Acidimicrobiales bacterium]
MPDEAELRESLVHRLVADGVLRSPGVARAMVTVRRHRFVPDVDPVAAYADESLVRKTADGEVVSTISQPRMVATMLELARVHPGARVLEVGTGTGYNAALLAELAGPTGVVVSMEIDEEMAAAARAVLGAEGYPSVRVLAGDGSAGMPALSPFDAIVVTAAADEIEPAWAAQLAPRGRLVVPFRRRNVAVAFEQRDGGLVAVGTVRAHFVALRHR